MLKKLIVMVLAWTLCLPAFALLPLHETEVDWGNNEIATDKDNFPSSFPSIEFQLGRNPLIYPVVYKFGQNPTVNVKFHNPNVSAGGTGDIVLDQAELVVGTTSYPLLINGATSYTESASWTGGSTYTTATVTLTGVPDVVQKGTLKIRAGVINCFTFVASGVTEFPYYRIIRAAKGNQSVPWTNVLDYSCVWSDGLTTDGQCRNANTTGMFDSAPMTFADPALDVHFTTEYWVDPADTKFKLKDFFNATTLRRGDSVDIACFLQLSLQALGTTMSTTMLTDSSGSDFVTNDVCLIGVSRLVTANYSKIIFREHLVCTNSTKVWDSTVALLKNLSGASYKNCARNWDTTGYWQTGANGLVWRHSGGTDSPPSTLDPTLTGGAVGLTTTAYNLLGVK